MILKPPRKKASNPNKFKAFGSTTSTRIHDTTVKHTNPTWHYQQHTVMCVSAWDSLVYNQKKTPQTWTDELKRTSPDPSRTNQIRLTYTRRLLVAEELHNKACVSVPFVWEKRFVLTVSYSINNFSQTGYNSERLKRAKSQPPVKVNTHKKLMQFYISDPLTSEHKRSEQEWKGVILSSE